MKLKFPLFLLGLVAIIYSCDKIEDPYINTGQVNDSNIIWDDSAFSPENNGDRFVLMEEYTGHKCRNCPAGAKEIENIRTDYGEKFIPIAIHMIDAFAAPGNTVGGPEGSYESDYRTEEGLAYQNAFQVPSLPGGNVSRRNSPPVSQFKWREETEKILNDPDQAIANLDMTGYYDDSSKTYRVRVIIEWLRAYTSGLNLQVQMVEDHITDWQYDLDAEPSVHVENYDHRHMFRESVNGAWGVPLVNAASVNQLDTFIYTKTFDPNNIGYKIDDIIVVGFLYEDPADGYEVLQVNEVHLTNNH